MKAWLTLPLLLLIAACNTETTPDPEPDSTPSQATDTTPREETTNTETPDPATAKHYIGTYSVTTIVDGNPIDESTIPPGQRTYLELKEDFTWSLQNMLSIWDGTWELKDQKLTLININGPAGPIDDEPPMTLTPTPDRTLLEMIPEQDLHSKLEFRFDPDIKQKITDAVNERMRSMPKTP